MRRPIRTGPGRPPPSRASDGGTGQRCAVMRFRRLRQAPIAESRTSSLSVAWDSSEIDTGTSAICALSSRNFISIGGGNHAPNDVGASASYNAQVPNLGCQTGASSSPTACALARPRPFQDPALSVSRRPCLESLAWAFPRMLTNPGPACGWKRPDYRLQTSWIRGSAASWRTARSVQPRRGRCQASPRISGW